MPTLSYDFAVVGLGAINRAFATIEARMRQHNRFVERSFGGARGGTGGTSGGGRRGGFDGSRRIAGAGQDDAWFRAAQRAQQKHLNKLAADQKIADKKRIASEKAADKEIVRNRQQAYRDMERRDRAHSSELRSQQRRAAKANRMRPSWAGRAQKSLGRMGQAALTAAALGGGMLMSAGIEAGFSSERAESALTAQAKLAGAKGGFGEIKQGIHSAAGAVATTKGMSREDVTKGMSAFFDVAGDIDMSKKIAPFIADLSDAASTDMTTAGNLAGKIFAHAIAEGMDDDKALAFTKQVSGTFVAAAAKGFESTEAFAKSAGELMTIGQMMGGGTAKGAASAATFAQIAKFGGVGTGEGQADVTATKRFAQSLSKHKDRFGYAFDKEGNLKDLPSVAMAMVSANKGDVAKLFGRGGLSQTGFTPLQALANIYKKAGGGAAGEKAMKSFVGKVGVTEQTDIEGTAEDRRKNDKSRQLEAAWSNLKDQVGDKLVPAIAEAIPKFAELTPQIVSVADSFAKLASVLVENPFTGMGAMMAADIAKEIAISKIESSFSGAASGADKLAAAAGVAAIAWGYVADQMPKLQQDVEGAQSQTEAERQMSLIGLKPGEVGERQVSFGEWITQAPKPGGGMRSPLDLFNRPQSEFTAQGLGGTTAAFGKKEDAQAFASMMAPALKAEVLVNAALKAGQHLEAGAKRAADNMAKGGGSLNRTDSPGAPKR